MVGISDVALSLSRRTNNAGTAWSIFTCSLFQPEVCLLSPFTLRSSVRQTRQPAHQDGYSRIKRYFIFLLSWTDKLNPTGQWGKQCSVHPLFCHQLLLVYIPGKDLLLPVYMQLMVCVPFSAYIKLLHTLLNKAGKGRIREVATEDGCMKVTGYGHSTWKSAQNSSTQ